LDSSTVSNGFIGIDTSVWLLSVEEVLDELLNLGDTSGTTDQDDFIDLSLLKTSILHGSLDWSEGLLEEISVEFFESGSGKDLREFFTVEQVFDLDLDFVDVGEGSLTLFDFSLELLDGSLVLTEILVVLLVDELDEVVEDSLIEILTSQMGVTTGGHDFEDTGVDTEDGDIESTTTEIEDNDVFFTLLVETVGNSGSSGLVDDSDNVETSDGTGILSGESLGIVEVGWDGDDGVLDLGTEVTFSDFLHLDEDHSGDFFRSEGLGFSVDDGSDVWLAFFVDDVVWHELLVSLDFLVSVPSTDETLDVVDGSGGVDRGLVLGGLTDQSFFISEGDDGWGDTVTEFVGDDLDSSVLVDTDTRVGGTEIDTDDGAVRSSLLLFRSEG